MSLQVATPNIVQNTNPAKVEISIKGKWLSVPALHIGDNSIICRGGWLKMGVIHNEHWLDSAVCNPDRLVKVLTGETSTQLRPDIFTFAQIPPDIVPRYNYITEWESIAAASTRSFDAWWKELPQETRKNVRRAHKRGVTVTVSSLSDELVRQIVDLNNDSARRQNIPFAHYGKTFDQVKKDQSSYLDRSDFICAYLDDELIGLMKIVYRGESASILQFIPKSSQQDKRPANALIAKAVELCESKGISYLTYGMLNYGNKRDSSLREFKLRNGFREMLVPRFYIPLTAKGKLCVALKLHRGLLGILPPRVIRVLVGARARWYGLFRRAGIAQG